MDSYSAGGLAAGITLAMWIAHTLYININHRRVVSKCCGKIFSASIDIDETTPRQNQIIPEQSLINSEQPVINNSKVPELSATVDKLSATVDKSINSA